MNTDDALAQMAAFGLPGNSSEVVVPDDPDELLGAAEAARALPWVVAASTAGQIGGVDARWGERLRQAHLRSVHATMASHMAAAAVMRRLRDAGVRDVVILKGVATGHLDYGRPIERFSTDVDLLVRTADVATVLTMFPDGSVPEPRRQRWESRYGKAITVVSDKGVELDVHTTLAQGYFGLAIDCDELFGNAVEFSIRGTRLRALDAPNRLLHAALHLATSEHVGLHSARDVPQLVLVCGADWSEMVIRARGWGIDAIVARGVLDAWSRFPLADHSIIEWARGVRPAARQRLALSQTGGAHARQYVTGPLALPIHRWPGYVFPIVWPSKAYLSEHGKTRTQRIRLLVPSLLSGGARRQRPV